MAASFPAAQKTFTQQTDNVSAADATDVNAIYDEVEAVEGHLGAGSIVAGQILLNSASSVDPWISLQINSVEKFRLAVDDSDSDKLKIHTGAAADPSLWEMSLTGHIELTNVAETASDPGRHLYLQRVHTSALGSGKGLTGVEVRSTFNGDADALASEVKGGEFKARHTTGNTYDVGTFKGVIGNVDVKNGTVTTGWAVEGAIDVSSGGTFTTAACFHGNLNNSGTVTNSYGVYVHGLSGNVLTRGLYVDYATTGIYLDNCTTDIRLQDGATIVNSTANGGTLTITEDNIVLVGGGWGKIAFGGYTDWGTGSTGTDIDGAGYDWVTSTVGHLDSGTLATAVAAAYHAMTVTVNQTTSTSVFGTWTELYFKNSVDLGGSNNYASVWGQMEGGTSVTSPDTGMFMTAFYGNVKMGSTLTIAAGVAVNGFRAQAEISAVTNNGRLAAFECLKSGGVDWEYGLYLANMTTGIDIGACTTGVVFTGTLATGISFYNATFVPDANRTDIAFELGSRANELTVDMAQAGSQNFDPIQLNVNVTATGTGPTDASTTNLIYSNITHDTDDMAYLRLKCADWNISVNKDLQDAYVYQGQIDYGAAATAVNGESAVMSLNMNAGSGDVAGNLRGLIINMYGAGLTNASTIGLELRSDGGSAMLDEGIRIWAVGANTITTGINFASAITTGISAGNNLLIPNLISVGAADNGIHWATASENIMIYTEAITATPGTYTCNKFQLQAYQAGATTSGRLECFRAETTTSGTHNVTAALRALVGQVTFDDDCTYVGSGPQGCIALIGAVHSGHDLTATGDVFALGLFMGVETGSDFNGESAFIYCYNYGKTAPESLINHWPGPGTSSQMTYLIDCGGDVLGSNHQYFSADVCATQNNDSDGCIKVRLGTTVYEIPIFLA